MTARTNVARERDIALIRTLATMVDERDGTTGEHCANVAHLGARLWREVTGTEPDEDLIFGFLLHDVGKLAVPDEVLLKEGPLDPEEFAAMRRHVGVGARVADYLGLPPIIAEVIRAHHERWDGTGYPHGLRGHAIPLGARVFSVVDAYDAMVADRPYRSRMSHVNALREIGRFAGVQFDPQVVAAFLVMATRDGVEPDRRIRL